ncbi:GH92 family glycosyl hydrolase [Nocardioides sp.]|uniref:GH92 family glycosyl hydrolase n=1 Tax=Nocardioides sp. TaxID=35761 RepID=UPI0037844F4C
MGRATEDVDPFVGTGGPPPWRDGATTPAATVPFGMVQLGPDTTDDETGRRRSVNPSGYAATDRFLRGFSPTHLSGAGGHAFGDAPLLPVCGALPADPGTATAVIDRSTERARPGRYGVTLRDGIAVDLAATTRAGLLRLSYPDRHDAFVLVRSPGGATVSSDHELTVRAHGGGFCGSPTDYVVHVVYRFDRPFTTHGSWPGGAWVGFGPEPLVHAQVAVSYVDAAGARANLDRERPGWSVPLLAERADAAWETELGRIEVDGSDATARRVFRTALYHVLVAPTPVSDVDGRYPGFDGRVHRLPDGELQLSSVSGWDVYRTEVPLLALLRPDVASQVVRSLHRDAVEGGWLPRWPLVAAETGIMNGDSAAPVAAAAWAFGARAFPLDAVVDRLVEQGDRPDGPREGLADYLSRGWVPVPDVRFGASTTLEYATDDFAISCLARAAGRTDVAARYLRRSGSWRSLLDPARSLLQPRDSTGAFPPPEADALACGAGFEEGNALQYTFGGVPQDVAGLLAALGPPQRVRARLDAFFTELDAGGEPHAWLGNEPSFLSPFVYHWLGDPARTQDVVARARAELWSLAPTGIPGNDDLGAMSAWFVWTALGLYPLTPGTGAVAVGVPAFDGVVVRPRGGSPLRVSRAGSGRHVAALRVDGADRGASWLDLDPDRRPREIAVATTDATTSWGTRPEDRPPSYPPPG